MKRLTPEGLHRRLERLAGRRLDLVLTSNATNYISFNVCRRNPLRVRLHRAFLYAPRPVVTGVGRWLAGRYRACPDVVQRFIDRPPREAARMVRTARPLQPRGQYYDLQQILGRVNRRHFRGRLRVRITWGRRGPQRAVYARTIGAYYENERLIVMNPVLDDPSVPGWFLAFTVYHECLHAVQPPSEPPHGRWFNEQLRRHPDYQAAARWEKANVVALTGRARRRFGLSSIDRLREYLDL